MYFLDAGLLGALSELPPEILLRGTTLFTKFNGARGGTVLPLEVKAGVNLKSQSLRVYDEKYYPPVLARTAFSISGNTGG